MALIKVKVKALLFSEIPQELTKDSWLESEDYKDIGLLQVHIDDDESDELTDWIVKNYPELKEEESFFIKFN